MAKRLFEASSLRKLVRSHRSELLTDDLTDNISSHSFLVIWIAYIIAKAENADITETLEMAMIHDMPESRTGDLNWINKRYVKAFEDEVINDMFDIGILNDLREMFKKYEERNTLEAKVVKDADRLAQLIVLKEHIATGNELAKKWTFDRQHTPLFTNTGQVLWDEIMKIKPSDWIENLGIEKRR